MSRRPTRDRTFGQRSPPFRTSEQPGVRADAGVIILGHMGASASLSPRVFTVEAGSNARCQVKVRNTGTVVDQFVIDVVGNAGAFATTDPASLNLLPGDEGESTITFSPPRAHTAGDVPFGVRVFSREDPSGSTVEEGVLTIGAFSELVAEVVPHTARGRRAAHYEVAVDNRGNVPVNADLLPSDPDQLLRFDTRPPAIVCEPGTATFAKLTARPKRRFWRGPAKTMAFQVTAAPNGAPPTTADGAMVQEALVPRWLVPALAALAALALILLVMWNTLFKPAIQDAAKDQAKKTLAATSKKANDAAAAANKAAGAAASAAKSAKKAGGGGGGASTPGSTAPPNASTTPPALTALIAGGAETAFRLQAATNPGATQSLTSPQPPPGKTLMLTDIVLENPNGDSGLISLSRGTDTIFVLGLANFRDLDYHFVAPLLFTNGQLTVRVQCSAPGTGNGGPPPTQCTPAVSMSGVVTTLSTPLSSSSH
jgi:hypothetical protein